MAQTAARGRLAPPSTISGVLHVLGGPKLVAYEPVDWGAPKPKPIKPPTPKPPSRKSLQARLKKLDAETKQLREQLKALDE
jgi:hypothetical protein